MNAVYGYLCQAACRPNDFLPVDLPNLRQRLVPRRFLNPRDQLGGASADLFALCEALRVELFSLPGDDELERGME